MTQLTIYLHGNHNLFHYCQHIAATVQDLSQPSGHNTFDVNYYPDGNSGELCERNVELMAHHNNWFCNDIVILHSDRSLAGFKEAFTERFNENTFAILNNNCADAVDFTLDYFFPDKQCVDVCCYLYQLTCFLPCAITLGLDCFTFPPCINSPKDVFRKALLLARTHSHQLETETRPLLSS